MSGIDELLAARAAAAAEPPMTLAVTERAFMENIREALENGFDRCCSRCGIGVYDDSDTHERACPEYVEPDYR